VSKILCKQIFELDKTIRFVGVANMEGKMIAQEYRKLLRSLLTIVESELSTMQSIIRLRTRKVQEVKLGKTSICIRVIRGSNYILGLCDSDDIV
jgi:hypothetical protein